MATFWLLYRQKHCTEQYRKASTNFNSASSYTLTGLMYVLYCLHDVQTVTYIYVFQQAQDDEETLRVIMQVRRLTHTLVMDSFEEMVNQVIAFNI